MNKNKKEFNFTGNDNALRKAMKDNIADRDKWAEQISANYIEKGQIGKGMKKENREEFTQYFNEWLDEFLGDQAEQKVEKEQQQTQHTEVKEGSLVGEPSPSNPGRTARNKWSETDNTMKDTDSARDKFKKSLGDEFSRQDDATKALKQLMLDNGSAEPGTLETQILSLYPDLPKERVREIARRAIRDYSGHIKKFNRIVKGSGHPENVREVRSDGSDLSSFERGESGDIPDSQRS